MATKQTCLYKILYVIIFLKVFFLFTLYWRSYQHYVDSRIRQMPPNYNDMLRIDQSEEPSWEKRMDLIAKEMPALPIHEINDRNALVNGTPECAAPPALMDIEFHNDYWQVARVNSSNFYIFGAYYDCRKAVAKAPLVRLLTMVNVRGLKDDPYPQTHCQLWFPGQLNPMVVPVHEHNVMWPWGGNAIRHYYPTLLSCAVPDIITQIPEMVTLVGGEPCQKGRNLLKVIYNKPINHPPPLVAVSEQQQKSRRNETPTKKDPVKPRLKFAVCVKAMDFIYKDMSWRIIEWLELVRLLGADKIVFYDAQMHPNMTRVLDYYMKKSPGFVELRALSMGRGEPHSKPHFHHYAMAADGFNRILNEMIPYNDCYYRNMYRYDYIGIFDIDEIIMPLGNVTNWSDLIHLAYRVPDYLQQTPARCKSWVSICFRNVYYPRYVERPKVFRHLPSYYYMLQHVERVQEHCNRFAAAKCLHSTKFAVGMHNHFPFFYTKDATCNAKSVPVEFAQMQHYREPDNKTRLIDPIIDDNIWRFQPELQHRTHRVYKELGFLPNLQEIADNFDRRRRLDELELQKLHKQEQENP